MIDDTISNSENESVKQKKDTDKPKLTEKISEDKANQKKSRSPSGPLALAVIKVLEANGKPMKVPQIFEALQESGYVWMTNNPKKLLYIRIVSMQKSGVIRVGKAMYALANSQASPIEEVTAISIKEKNTPAKIKKKPRSPSGPLAPAVVKILKDHANPMKVNQIFKTLQKNGYIWMADNPKKLFYTRIVGMQKFGVIRVGKAMYALANLPIAPIEEAPSITKKIKPAKIKKKPLFSGPLAPAVINILETHGKPMKVAQIFEELQKSGYTWKASNPRKLLYIRIAGMQKSGVIRVGKATYALTNSPVAPVTGIEAAPTEEKEKLISPFSQSSSHPDNKKYSISFLIAKGLNYFKQFYNQYTKK